MTQVLFNSAVRRLETCLLQIDDDCVSFYFATLLASTKSSKVTAYYRSEEYIWLWRQLCSNFFQQGKVGQNSLIMGGHFSDCVCPPTPITISAHPPSLLSYPCHIWQPACLKVCWASHRQKGINKAAESGFSASCGNFGIWKQFGNPHLPINDCPS